MKERERESESFTTTTFCSLARKKVWKCTNERTPEYNKKFVHNSKSIFCFLMILIVVDGGGKFFFAIPYSPSLSRNSPILPLNSLPPLILLHKVITKVHISKLRVTNFPGL